MEPWAFRKENGRGPSSEGDQVPGFNALLQATVRSSQWPQSQGPRDGGGWVGLTVFLLRIQGVWFGAKLSTYDLKPFMMFHDVSWFSQKKARTLPCVPKPKTVLIALQRFRASNGCVWKCCVPHCTQWFCWSLSLWKMAISLGIYPTFSDKPKWLWKLTLFFGMRQKALELWNLPQHGPGSPWNDLRHCVDQEEGCYCTMIFSKKLWDLDIHRVNPCDGN